MATRDDILRGRITKTDKILEIGPSYSPLAPKADGWRSYVVDHTDRDGLVEKYRGPSRSIRRKSSPLILSGRKEH
jgi:hypothetical protein